MQGCYMEVVILILSLRYHSNLVCVLFGFDIPTFSFIILVSFHFFEWTTRIIIITNWRGLQWNNFVNNSSVMLLKKEVKKSATVYTSIASLCFACYFDIYRYM